jgi:hypothetical protein
MALAPTGQIETFLAYDLDLTLCERELCKAGQGWIGGLGYTQTDVFVFRADHLQGDGGHDTLFGGEGNDRSFSRSS